MTEAEKQIQRERIEQAAKKLGAELDMTARQITDNTGSKVSYALWAFLLGVVFGASVGALTGGTLASGWAVVVP